MLKRVLSVALPVAAAAAFAGCGGADGPVPNVVGQRLDVAISELEDQGFGTEAVGGGAFGIIDESNWTVCETRPSAGATESGDVKLVVDRSCSGAASTADASASASEPSEPVSEAEPVAELEPVESSAAASEPAPAVRRITVPDVVGLNHQAAQNRMQAAGLFILDEKDATGQGRILLYDRNWVVVSQSPAPGKRVSEDRTILLSSKKLGE